MVKNIHEFKLFDLNVLHELIVNLHDVSVRHLESEGRGHEWNKLQLLRLIVEKFGLLLRVAVVFELASNS